MRLSTSVGGGSSVGGACMRGDSAARLGDDLCAGAGGCGSGTTNSLGAENSSTPAISISPDVGAWFSAVSCSASGGGSGVRTTESCARDFLECDSGSGGNGSGSSATSAGGAGS